MNDAAVGYIISLRKQKPVQENIEKDENIENLYNPFAHCNGRLQQRRVGTYCRYQNGNFQRKLTKETTAGAVRAF